jgi:hypothetical protein
MPRNKDLKHLVRARMEKTGESYTAARAVILLRHDASGPKTAAPRSEWASLAGMSDEAVRTRTGRDWARWVALLDEVQAHRMSHRDIARHVYETYDVGGWWVQMITVGYERIRGLREVGQQRGGSYEAGKSRTFPVGVSGLFRMFHDARKRKRWLPEGLERVRTFTIDKSMRVDWNDGTRVNLFFVRKAAAKSTVTIEHTRLGTRADVARAKAFWTERLDALAGILQ